MLSEVPSKVLEHLNLPAQDLGIDLIAKTGKEYHAIQCKYHSDKTSSVTFKEVSTFLSLLESNKKLTLGYICSSADVTSKNFQKIKTDKISTLMSDVWQKLDEDFFKQAHAQLKGKEIKLKPFQPRKHQTKALKEAVKYFGKENHSRGKLIFPCGAGKSLTGFWMTQKLKSKSTLIAVPSLSLVKQTLEVYLREIVATNKEVKWLCICSDEGIGKNDDVVIYTENLGVPCQTDPEYIEQWLKDNINEEKIIFTTYQSGRIIAEISKRLNFTFDIGIFDEAHKTVGSDKKLFSHLLFEKNIAISKRIFMTATERFYAGSKDDIISMDDEDVYGDTFALMSFKEAIELGLLTDYKVITIDVKKSEIADFIKDNNLVQLNDKWKKETEARSLASMLALRKAMKRFNIKNAVSFHSSIEKARRNKDLQQHITDTYDYQPIDTYTVSGKDATTKRNDIVQEFARSEKALITNARCLTEGVDVPNIDCIVFADPRKSRVDIVQALGRALRKKKGKEWGYVILPVIYDDATSEIDNDNFNEILNVVRGLAANDERIVEYFKDKGEINTKAQKEIEEQFNFEVLSEYMDEGELSKQLQIKVWEKLSKFNWMEFEEAREFVHSLNLSNQNEWGKYCTSGKKPADIPSNPNLIYAEKGWEGYSDWIGTYTVANQLKEFKSFSDARKFVQKLELKGENEWREYFISGKKPNDIPTAPDRIYKNKGWKSWGDWLGTNNVANRLKTYKEFKVAREIVQKLKLNGEQEWRNYCTSGKKPNDIPSNAPRVYKDEGWESWGDWLGSGNVATNRLNFKPFSDAKIYISKLELKSNREWREYLKSGGKPEDIPASPERTYKDKGWKGWRDFLGLPENEFKTFDQAKSFVQSLNFSSSNEWRKFSKSGNKPSDIPTTCDTFYKDKGWKGWRDFLGLPENEFKTFEQAKLFVRSLNFSSSSEWREYNKSGNKPSDIPSFPERKYKEQGWKGWRDFLGLPENEFKTFEQAKLYIKSIDIKSKTHWEEWSKNGNRPSNIPSNPQRRYKDKGWKGWKDFFGNE